MQVGNLSKLPVGCSAVLAIVVVVLGCDRASPEKLSKKADVSGIGSEGGEGDTKAELTRSDKFNDQKLLGSEDPQPTSPVGNSPELESPASEEIVKRVDLSDRTFMTLQPVKSSASAELESHLKAVDVALRDLIVAAANKVVDADTFNSSGMRLGQMKLTDGEKLAASPDATDEQRKLGTVSQLVALSHMSGLKDIESAKKLEKFASTLLQSSDPDLAHQGRVVLLGFRLQDLQNGNVAEPTQLLSDLQGLFQRPSDAGFPEMMVLQQAQTVLTEMGFAAEANKIEELAIKNFMNSPDLDLSSTAWNLAVSHSQSFGNYSAAIQSVYEGKEREPQMLLGAARGLYEELPNATTLLKFVRLSTDLEYRGLVNIASELSAFVKAKSASLPDSPYLAAIASALEFQDRRLGVLYQSLDLDGVVDFEGVPLDWSVYKGKVVLIDFWATWCGPCLQELPNIRKVKEELGPKGFEVLSINMDENLSEATEFLKNNSLPWKSYRGNDLSALGFKSAIAKRLGINAIPFLVLVGGDGKVAAVHVRGDRLAPTVRSMLGDGLSN